MPVFQLSYINIFAVWKNFLFELGHYERSNQGFFERETNSEGFLSFGPKSWIKPLENANISTIL